LVLIGGEHLRKSRGLKTADSRDDQTKGRRSQPDGNWHPAVPQGDESDTAALSFIGINSDRLIPIFRLRSSSEKEPMERPPLFSGSPIHGAVGTAERFQQPVRQSSFDVEV
jgi:hypothetical protein